MKNDDDMTRVGHLSFDASEKKFKEVDPMALPLLPTRDFVLFPGVTFPISLGRESTVKIAEWAYEKGEPIGVVCQRRPEIEKPKLRDLYDYGVVATVLKVFDLPDGSKTAILAANDKFRKLRASMYNPCKDALTAEVKVIREPRPRSIDREFFTLATAIKHTALKLMRSIQDGPADLAINLENFNDAVAVVNMVATHLPTPVSVRQEMLEVARPKQRAFKLLMELSRNEQMVAISRSIQERTKQHITEQQRQAFLHEQMESIRKELYGDETDATRFKERANETKLSEAARAVFDREVEKLDRMNPQSPEYYTLYTYLETLLSLPWDKESPAHCDIKAARETLDADHYGLEKVKERILEQLAVMQLRPEGHAPIICLVGAPGVGKTSLGQSIARALGREYHRVSLGGLHDEAEIRGHRRTYIGAMPGRIIEAMRRVGTRNPVMLLDEIDKMSSDFRGDPAAAMLEVLDPEQNSHFHDNYVDVDFDLSRVVFIATANTLSTVAQPLLDRMEVISISGYLLEEKLEIARRHLVPRVWSQCGIDPERYTITDEAITAIIEQYTSESGVRQLEKQLAKVARRLALAIVSQEADETQEVGPEQLKELLGVAIYTKDRYEGNEYPGVVTGLAWTAAGGEILFIESSLAPAKGEKLTLTGNLGDVMKESATIALQYVRAHSKEIGIADDAFTDRALHIHVPEGAIPKDGPSAGITMATSIASALTGRKVKPRIAMTGEITLRGKVLPVGGIKEKILAAKRAGIDTILLSETNRKDVEDIREVYREGLQFVYVNDVREVLSYALED